MDDILSQLKPLLLKIGLAAVVVGIVLILYRHLMQWYYRMQDRAKPRQVDPTAATEAEDLEGTIPLATRSSVRKWKVSGVEKTSGEDTTWYIEAESRANAKVKAELKGMIVTAVERAAGEI